MEKEWNNELLRQNVINNKIILDQEPLVAISNQRNKQY